MKDKKFKLLQSVDKSWTLFLDRDGVINDEKHIDYINSWEEFSFFKGTLEAIRILSQMFGHVFVVTNQRGVSRGRTKIEDLQIIHKNMVEEISRAGGRIDKIYFCTDMESSSPNRKPNPGMGLAAKAEFPQIDFSKSVMIGNTLSDMEFGRNLGVAINIFLPTTTHLKDQNPLADLIFPDLISVANEIAGSERR